MTKSAVKSAEQQTFLSGFEHVAINPSLEPQAESGEGGESRKRKHEKHKHKKGAIGPNFSKRFVKIVVKTGKSYEPGLAPTFMFKYGIRGMLDNMSMGMGLLQRRRMAIVPKTVKRIKNFRRVLNRIIPIGVAQ